MHMLKTTLLLALCMLVSWPALTKAQEKVLLIRHAEKEANDEDPALTEAGRMRAEAWADMFSDSDIQAVITTDARRTRETGMIIAGHLELERKEVATFDVLGLLDLLSFDHEDQTVLVVAHAETIPAILSALGSPKDVQIAQDDFTNLFVIIPSAQPGGVATHLRMH